MCVYIYRKYARLVNSNWCYQLLDDPLGRPSVYFCVLGALTTTYFCDVIRHSYSL